MWTGWPQQQVRDPLEIFYSLNNDKDGLIWEVPLLWTLKKPRLLQEELEPTSRAANDLFICKATQCYCSAFMLKDTQKYLLFPPGIILHSGDILSRLEDGKVCFLSVFFALRGPYILGLFETIGDCWEPCWPGCVPENILLNPEITASKMIAATPSSLCFGWNSPVPWRYLLYLSGWESRK